MTSAPFYANGLNFSCQRCSACCRYEAGFVFLSEEDIEKLSAELNMDKNSLITAFCRWVGIKGEESLSLKEKSNKDCIFWESSGCKVYNARPLQCLTFPFWESIVSSVHGWETAASGCPGIKLGKLHKKQEIDRYIKMRVEQPIINGRGIYQ